MSSRESYTSVINRKAAAKQQLMNVAMGRERADLVLKNAVYVNVFTNELSQGDIAVEKRCHCRNWALWWCRGT